MCIRDRGKSVYSMEATKFDKVVMKTANIEKITDLLLSLKIIIIIPVTIFTVLMAVTHKNEE